MTTFCTRCEDAARGVVAERDRLLERVRDLADDLKSRDKAVSGLTADIAARDRMISMHRDQVARMQRQIDLAFQATPGTTPAPQVITLASPADKKRIADLEREVKRLREGGNGF